MPLSRQLDQFDKHDQSRGGNPAVDNVRIARASEEFMADNPDYFPCGENTRVLLAWLNNADVPITRLNLQEAYDQLKSLGNVLKERPETVFHELKDQDKQGDRGVQKITNTLNLRFPVGSDAQRNLAGKNPHRMQEIMGQTIAEDQQDRQELRSTSEVGKPVSKELRQRYLASVRAQHAYRTSGAPLAEARACVGLNYPNVKVDSREFNRLVAELIAADAQ